MSSIVIELQRDALDRNVAITDLLRKALLVAKKLRIEEFEKWVNNELSGYKDPLAIPEYRRVHGHLKGWNEFRGWIPVIIPNAETTEIFSTRLWSDSIAQVESLLEGRDDSFQMVLPPKQERALSEAVYENTKFCLDIPRNIYVKIVDAVRTIILNWAIKLEEDGILGEGLSFTRQEREVAGRASYIVNHFYGNIHHQQIQQYSPSSFQAMLVEQTDLSDIKGFLEALQRQIEELKLPLESREELEAEIKTTEIQINSPKPKHGIIRESLLSVRRILESASGGVAAKLLIDYAQLFHEAFREVSKIGF